MSRITRLVALALAALMFFAVAGPASAQTSEPERDQVERDQVERERPVRCTDLAENDRRCIDPPVDRCDHRPHDFVDDHQVTDRCRTDHDHHIDINDPAQVRRLVKHFIKFGEWKLLVRLLHAIGIL